MACNFRSGEYRTINHTPSGADVTAGDVVVIGEVPFVCHRTIPDGELGALAAFGGCYQAPVAAAVANAGEKLYWDNTNDELTATASGNPHFGFSAGPSTEGDTLVEAIHAPEATTAV